MDMQGKVAVVTGATNGIGLVVARELALLGAHVYGVCRDVERCSRIEAMIRKETQNPQVEYLCADLSLMEQVRTLAADIRLRTEELHVLVNNAGAYFARRQTTSEGIETTFALNHLNYFLLTHLLLDLLKSSGSTQEPARIVNVASEAQRGGKLDEQVLLAQGKYRGFQAYASSKLSNIVFTYELSRRLADDPVNVNVMHPGFVATNFAMDNFSAKVKPVTTLYRKVSRLLARSPEQGADTVIWLASSPEAAFETGQYWHDRKAIRSQAISYDWDAARRLWDLSERLCGLSPVS